MREWRWADTRGDFPMAAMTAARLGEPQDRHPRPWLANGHNWQRANLPLYFAAAMMASAWNGFPKEDWNVRWEGSAPAFADRVISQNCRGAY
jgi:hypothetical protein